MSGPAHPLIPCVGAVIKDGQGRLLLIKRGHEPGLGLWSLPGGRIEPGETDAEALVREMAEETGLAVEPGPLVGRVQRPGPGGSVIDIRDYAATVIGGTLRPGDDAADACWADATELANLAVTDGLLEILTEWGVLGPERPLSSLFPYIRAARYSFPLGGARAFPFAAELLSEAQLGRPPAVSFLKAAAYQDAHPGYPDPLDEQTFLVNTINQIEESKYWDSTAIVITYDDSDGWYDSQKMPVVNGSDTTADEAICTSARLTLSSYPDRCGFGQRLPMLVISPWTRTNYVSNQLTDTASVINFIEDNWLGGQRIGGGSYDNISGNLAGAGGLLDFDIRPHYQPVILNPATGEVVKS